MNNIVLPHITIEESFFVKGFERQICIRGRVYSRDVVKELYCALENQVFTSCIFYEVGTHIEFSAVIEYDSLSGNLLYFKVITETNEEYLLKSFISIEERRVFSEAEHRFMYREVGYLNQRNIPSNKLLPAHDEQGHHVMLQKHENSLFENASDLSCMYTNYSLLPRSIIREGARICIVVSTLPHLGIGSAIEAIKNENLVNCYNSLGHSLMVLLVSPGISSSPEYVALKSTYANKGIDLFALEEERCIPLQQTRSTSYYVYKTLHDSQIDLLVFSNNTYLGYDCLCAKKNMIAFKDTPICIFDNSLGRVMRQAEGSFLKSHKDLLYDYFERDVLCYADNVYLESDSTRDIDSFQATGHRPMFKVSPSFFYKDSMSCSYARTCNEIDEIVFIDEESTSAADVLAFCDCVELLESSGMIVPKVIIVANGSYVGESTLIAYIKQRSLRWTATVECLESYSLERIYTFISKRDNALFLFPFTQIRNTSVFRFCVENKKMCVATSNLNLTNLGLTTNAASSSTVEELCAFISSLSRGTTLEYEIQDANALAKEIISKSVYSYSDPPTGIIERDVSFAWVILADKASCNVVIETYHSLTRESDQVSIFICTSSPIVASMVIGNGIPEDDVCSYASDEEFDSYIRDIAGRFEYIGFIRAGALIRDNALPTIRNSISALQPDILSYPEVFSDSTDRDIPLVLNLPAGGNSALHYLDLYHPLSSLVVKCSSFLAIGGFSRVAHDILFEFFKRAVVCNLENSFIPECVFEINKVCLKYIDSYAYRSDTLSAVSRLRQPWIPDNLELSYALLDELTYKTKGPELVFEDIYRRFLMYYYFRTKKPLGFLNIDKSFDEIVFSEPAKVDRTAEGIHIHSNEVFSFSFYAGFYNAERIVCVLRVASNGVGTISLGHQDDDNIHHLFPGDNMIFLRNLQSDVVSVSFSSGIYTVYSILFYAEKDFIFY